MRKDELGVRTLGVFDSAWDNSRSIWKTIIIFFLTKILANFTLENNRCRLGIRLLEKMWTLMCTRLEFRFGVW